MAVGPTVLRRAETVPGSGRRAAGRGAGAGFGREAWLSALSRDELLALVREQFAGDRELRRRLELRAADAGRRRRGPVPPACASRFPGHPLLRRVPWRPWRYTAADCRAAVAATPSASPLAGTPAGAVWDPDLPAALTELGARIEEEMVLDDLPADLGGR
ncbi:DUF2399 domain-containing protein [Streptomyces rubradiris]|uniref:DUF2399 domain-containing protein n=1 Tax=Streptomyces rubradiris TaxID=285531 RepID=A0ABQ3RPT7_STRRR|nr:DUF2399 domain-containing protein [Streptomyces rubradiris]GHH17960.1 hypothetical protein GCM10018792_49220 [Streptomyces rubradiris]GHI57883.1 hypothetical protein Srubr_77290 [Streptomyces rubradiris]